MKLYSLPGMSELTSGRTVRAEVVASEGGRSLVLVNGVPTRADGEFPPGHSLSGQLAATDGGFKIIAGDNSTGVSAEKMLENAGIHEGGAKLTAAFKGYGVPLTQENLKLAGEFLLQLPGAATDRQNFNLVALLLSRRLGIGAGGLLKDYLAGNLKFEHLFAGLEKGLLSSLKQGWGQGKLLEMLQQLIKQTGSSPATELGSLTGKIDALVANLQLQEILTVPPDQQNEGRLYFQWPIFWQNQELPDTLEGEASTPGGQNLQQGFSLRLLINPPGLGHLEVAMHQLNKTLWVHFGAEPEALDSIRSLFPILRQRLIGEDYDQIRLTAGKVRLLQNFFSSATEEPAAVEKARIDLRV